MKSVLLKSVSLLFLTSLLISSCTVQKRRYNSGYHVDWHLNLAAKNSIQAKGKVAMNKPSPYLVEEAEVIQRISDNYPLSKIDTIPSLKLKFKVLKDQKSSTLVKEISQTVKKLEIVKNVSSKLSRNILNNTEQIEPSEEDPKTPKGVWSFILALSTYGFLLSFAFLIGPEVYTIALILLVMALVSVIMSLVMGFKAIDAPQDTTDLVFGIIGLVLSFIPLIVLVLALL